MWERQQERKIVWEGDEMSIQCILCSMEREIKAFFSHQIQLSGNESSWVYAKLYVVGFAINVYATFIERKLNVTNYGIYKNNSPYQRNKGRDASPHNSFIFTCKKKKLRDGFYFYELYLI